MSFAVTSSLTTGVARFNSREAPSGRPELALTLRSPQAAPPSAPAPSSPPPSGAGTSVAYTLDFATNAGTFSGTQRQLGTLVRQVYKGPIGPFTKFYDGNKGIRAGTKWIGERSR